VTEQFLGERTCQGLSAISCGKAAELIESPFGMLSRVDPRSHMLDGVQIPLGNFEGSVPDVTLP